MLAHLLPDGRVPVLLSAHDESLISQDARAILDFLDRSGEGDDPTPAVASTLLRLRRVRRHRAVARVADELELVVTLSALACGDEHPLVARSAKSGGLHIAFVFPGRATSGHRWAQTPTSDCRHTGRRPTDAPRRSPRPGSRHRCRI